MPDTPPTPLETLRRAADLGREAGLVHVYVGNAPELGLEHTTLRRVRAATDRAARLPGPNRPHRGRQLSGLRTASGRSPARADLDPAARRLVRLRERRDDGPAPGDDLRCRCGDRRSPEASIRRSGTSSPGSSGGSWTNRRARIEPLRPARMPLGILVPHAGLSYSGLVAAAAWRRLGSRHRTAPVPGRTVPSTPTRHDRAPRHEPRGGLARRGRRLGGRGMAHAARRRRRRRGPRSGRSSTWARRSSSTGWPTRASTRSRSSCRSSSSSPRGPGSSRSPSPRGPDPRHPGRPAARGAPGGATAGRRSHRPCDQLGHGPLPAGGPVLRGDRGAAPVDRRPRRGRSRPGGGGAPRRRHPRPRLRHVRDRAGGARARRARRDGRRAAGSASPRRPRATSGARRTGPSGTSRWPSNPEPGRCGPDWRSRRSSHHPPSGGTVGRQTP